MAISTTVPHTSAMAYALRKFRLAIHAIGIPAGVSSTTCGRSCQDQLHPAPTSSRLMTTRSALHCDDNTPVRSLGNPSPVATTCTTTLILLSVRWRWRLDLSHLAQ